MCVWVLYFAFVGVSIAMTVVGELLLGEPQLLLKPHPQSSHFFPL